MIDRVAERQLPTNETHLMTIGRSEPQLLIPDALQQDAQRPRHQSIKKRIPLKKGGPSGGAAKVNNSSFQDVSQSAPGSRKQSVKRAGDHLVSSYLGATGMNTKQNIESAFSYNMNKPNWQKYLKHNRSMILLRDPKKRVQSVTVVPTRNTALQKGKS